MNYVGFIDNFVSSNGKSVNRPIPILAKINRLTLSPCGNYHTAQTDQGTFRRSVAYHENSPYGWERCD